MLYVKALHVISVVSWFAGIFYLPRLFVYHAQCQDSDAEGNARFKVMERKLYWGIMTPSALLSTGFGLWMTLSYAWDAYKTMGWLHAKLALVVLLWVFHLACYVHIKAFAKNRNTKSHTYFRVFNELPVLLLVGIVILVIVKPF